MSEHHHDELSRSDMERMIVDILEKAGASYLPVSQIMKRLPTAQLGRLGLGRKRTGNARAIAALNACFGERLKVYRGPRAAYIGLDRAPEEIVLEKIAQYPGISARALAGRLPMLKRDCIACLNRLAACGRIRVTLDHAWRSTLWPPAENPPDGDLKALFKDAYDRVGNGRGFVRIHRIRDDLRWPDDVFVRVLEELMAAYAVELHGGDPSALSDSEIRRSFVDSNGTLYITLSWWGEDHD